MFVICDRLEQTFLFLGGGKQAVNMVNTSDHATEGLTTEGPKAEEIKEWINIGRSARGTIGDPGSKIDLSNMASVINYLNAIGLVTDIERIKLKAKYERK